MSAATTLIRQRSREAHAATEKARTHAVLAVRAVEQSLKEAVGPAGVRGLSILAWPNFRGASVVGPRMKYGVDTRVPHYEVLVLLPTADLAWARVTERTGEVAVRGLLDGEIREEHLRDLEWTIDAVARKHASRCEQDSASARAVEALASRLRQAATG